MVGLEASAFTLIAQYEVYAWSQATEGTLTPSEPALTGAVGSQPKPGGAQSAKPGGAGPVPPRGHSGKPAAAAPTQLSRQSTEPAVAAPIQPSRQSAIGKTNQFGGFFGQTHSSELAFDCLQLTAVCEVSRHATSHKCHPRALRDDFAERGVLTIFANTTRGTKIRTATGPLGT